MTRNRIWAVGSILLIIGILALGYFVGVSPKLSDAAAAAAQTAQVNLQNQQYQAAVTKLKGQYSTLDALQAQLAKLQLAIPADAHGDTFLSYVANATKASGVQLVDATLLEPTIYSGTAPAQPGVTTTAPDPATTPDPSATAAPPVTTPTTGGSAATAPGPTAGQAYYFQVVIHVDGTPAEVLSFDNLLQSGPRFFLNTILAFQSKGASSAGVSTGASSSSGGSKDGGTLTGWLFVVAGKDMSPTSTPVPVPTSTATPLPTPTGTSTPKP